MNLYQASSKRSSITNNTWTNSAGQVIYKVKTPFKVNRTTTIYRIRPSSEGPSTSIRPPPPISTHSQSSVSMTKSTEVAEARSDDEDDMVEDVEHIDFRDHFATLAEIEWKLVASSILKWNGQEFPASSFLRKQSWGWYGRHRVFTAPDGREFKWILGAFKPELILNEASKAVVARYHRRRIGLFSPSGPRPAYLEIMPGYEHMADLIFFTLIYIEKIRKDKERAARSSGGGGGGDGGG